MYEVTTFAGEGADAGGFHADNSGQLAIDGYGDLFAASFANLLEITPDGTESVYAGDGNYGYLDTYAGAAEFNELRAVAVGPGQTIYLGDEENNRIRKIDLALNVTTFSGNGSGNVVDGTGGPNGTASYWDPLGLALAPDGSLYVTDDCTLRHIDRSGNVTTVAGVPSECTDIDGAGGAQGPARLDDPYGVAVGPDGAVYVATRTHIRRFDSLGNLSTFAGNGQCGWADGTGGPGGTASFCGPTSIAFDAQGNLIVADSLNFTIRLVDPGANVFTIAGGLQQGTRDGLGRTAQFEKPTGVAIDAHGNIFIADYTNIRKLVRLP